jgi:hypothetical protein
VIDLSTGIAGGYATKLFCDAGAVRGESRAAWWRSPVRHFTASGRDLAGRDAPAVPVTRRGKRSVVGAPGDAHIAAARARRPPRGRVVRDGCVRRRAARNRTILAWSCSRSPRSVAPAPTSAAPLPSSPCRPSADRSRRAGSSRSRR